MVSRRQDLELSSVEALWLEVSLPNSRGFLVGTFYRPDRTSKYYDQEFMTKLNIMLDLVLAQGKEVILTGDFNCCFMSNSRNNSDCNQLKSLFRYSDLKQLIAQPTRITKDTIWNDFRTGPYFIMHAEAVLFGIMHVQIFLVFEERNNIVTECIMK